MTEQILKQRAETHGSFCGVAVVAQELKAVISTASGYPNLNLQQKEALDMIASKIARIVCGNPDFKDHWDDISGYAMLVGRTL